MAKVPRRNRSPLEAGPWHGRTGRQLASSPGAFVPIVHGLTQSGATAWSSVRKDIIPYYRALGLSPGAEPIEIRRAYRQMIQQWHPDLYKPGSPMQTTAEDITKEINEAYDQLYRKKLYRSFTAKRDRKPEPGANPDREPVGSSGAKRNKAEPVRARRGNTRAPKPAKARRPNHWVGRIGKRWGAGAAVLALAAVLAPLEGVRTNPASLMDLFPVSREAIATTGEPAVAAVAAPSGVRRAESASMAAAAENPVRPKIAPPTVRSPAAPDVTGLTHSDSARLLARAEELLKVFERGDTKAKVLEIQGTPDEAGENIFRYGSSVVYFADGHVKSWLDRQPRLHVRDWSALILPTLDAFWKGSSRGEVVRAQGLPSAFDATSYSYGSSVILFDRGLVAGWSEGDTRLQQFEMPSLPFMDLDRMRLFDSGNSLEF